MEKTHGPSGRGSQGLGKCAHIQSIRFIQLTYSVHILTLKASSPCDASGILRLYHNLTQVPRWEGGQGPPKEFRVIIAFLDDRMEDVLARSVTREMEVETVKARWGREKRRPVANSEDIMVH